MGIWQKESVIKEEWKGSEVFLLKLGCIVESTKEFFENPDAQEHQTIYL